MKSEKEYYWLSVDGQTIPQWKKPLTPEGKRAVFKLMRKKGRKGLLPVSLRKKGRISAARKFEIWSSRRDEPIWKTGKWDVMVELRG